MIHVARSVIGAIVQQNLKIAVISPATRACWYPHGKQARAFGEPGVGVDVVAAENTSVVPPVFSAEAERMIATGPAEGVGEGKRTRSVGLRWRRRLHHWAADNGQGHLYGYAVNHREEILRRVPILRT